MEYLEAAFLIRTVHRVDKNARHFKRANFFKVYLTNPSIRNALYSPISSDSEFMGSLVETAIFSQWFHSDKTFLHYARWPEGEIDIVNVGTDQKVEWCVESKWSDSFFDSRSKMQHIIDFVGSIIYQKSQ